jgi:pyrimidine deaminase RibD-like protein
MVAAALVRGKDIVATGIHRLFGTAHGERDLLHNYVDPVEPDDVLVVNLEPCCPSPTKKTPPCTEIILARDVKHVAYGLVDPDVRVAGNGLKILHAAGVSSKGPVLEEACREHNRGFLTMRMHGRPWTDIAHTPDDIADFDYRTHAAVVGTDPEAVLRSLARPSEGFRPLHVYVGPEALAGQPGLKILRMQADIAEVTRVLITPDGGYHGITSMVLLGELGEQARKADLFDRQLRG